MRTTVSRIASTLAAGALLATAACGTGAQSPAGDGPTKIAMGVSRIADLAPLHLGDKQGFFRDEKIELELQPQQSGSVTITGVVSGDFQLGFSNTVSLLVAAAKGLPLRAIAPAASVGTDPETEDFTAIMVQPDSPINSVQDLAGKTIAVNTVNSMVDTLVRASLDAKGVDSASVKFIEIPFPDQVAALKAGRVDVITPQEPYLTAARDQQLKTVLAGYYATAIPNFTNGAFFTSTRFAQENPDVVQRFQRALERSVGYANAHPDEVRTIIPSFTGIDAQTAGRIALPLWEPEINRDTTEKLADLLVKYRLLNERPDVAEIIGITK